MDMNINFERLATKKGGRLRDFCWDEDRQKYSLIEQGLKHELQDPETKT